MKIKTYDSATVFFTSDNHWYHDNIRKYCSRPFTNVGEMNETLINNWNLVIKPDDTVFELGDMFPFCKVSEAVEVLSQLNGNIISLTGNHMPEKVKENLSPHIEYHDYLEIYVEDEEVGKQHICLFHYPINSWNGQHKGSWHLYGHQHNLTLTNTNASLDVGVDGHNFMPWSFEEVKVQITKQLINK